MSIAALTGGFSVPVGIVPPNVYFNSPGFTGNTMDAANEATIFLGHVVTSDGASHTIDTSGTSKLEWLSGAVTFANGSTVVKVGIAAVDTANGPAGRAVNVAGVITFDVSASFTGGGGGITASAWQLHTPDTGTKTIANGDLVAFCVQMTARGGVDSVIAQQFGAVTSDHLPAATAFVGGSYFGGDNNTAQPNCFITFADGATGWLYGTTVATTLNTRTWNSGSATKEYGQLYSFPFPTRIYGLWGWVDPDANFDMVLYSDPLGTPVAEKTISLDLNYMASSAGRRISVPFAAPYGLAANQVFGCVLKPGGSNISSYYKTINRAELRVVDDGGTSSYGISRASGAFANANSSLDHYFIGPILGAFEHGVQPTYALGI